MSNNKHKNTYCENNTPDLIDDNQILNNTNEAEITEEVNNEPEVIEEIVEEVITKESEVILEEPKIEVVNTEIHEVKDEKPSVPEIIEEPHIIEEVKPIPVVEEKKEVKGVTNIIKPATIFYRVGTGIIRKKCANQVAYTSDLEMAKTECNKARDEKLKTYYVFDKEGNAVYTAEYNIPKDNYYRVGTDFKNKKCINQKYYTVNLDEACKVANDNTKTTGMIHNVYDPSGKIVFSSKKKLTLLSYKKREVNKNADWYLK